MTTTVSTSTAALLMGALKTAFDAGGAAAYAKVYSGTQPAPGGTPTGTLVATVFLKYPCGTVDGSGVLNLDTSATLAVVVDASTPTWARVFDSTNARVLDCRCRLQSTSADPVDPEVLVIAADSLVVGALVRVLGGSWSAPT